MEDAPDASWQPKLSAGQSARGCGDEGDAEDAIGEQVWALVPQSHDRHPTHRVADEDERTGGGNGVDHLAQISAKLIHVVRVEVRAR